MKTNIKSIVNFVIVFLLMLFSTGCLGNTVSKKVEDEKISLHIAPYLQNVTQNEITIMWETTESVIGEVVYGKNEKFNQKVTEKQAVKIHEIRLSDLQPGTEYNYKVQCADTIFVNASFTTAPSTGTRHFRFVAYGDTRSNPDIHKEIAGLIMKQKPGLLINSGDMVYSGTKYKQWKNHLFDPMRGMMEYVPFYTCPGNHEDNADHYYNYMALPDENNEAYYSFDYGNVHFISLNSNAADAPYKHGDAQTEWLIQDLKDHKDAEWKIVFFHHPLFHSNPTRGVTAQRWVWQPIFDQYGVDFVINGHDHYYQRTYPIGRYQAKPRRGVYHLITGGGGAPLYNPAPEIHAAHCRKSNHIVVIDVQGDRLKCRAIDIKGNVFDTFTIDKKTKNSSDKFIAYDMYELKEKIKKAHEKMPVDLLNKSTIDIDRLFKIKNPFQVPVKLTTHWNHTPGWKTSKDQLQQVINPGEQIILPVKVVTEKGLEYPLPSIDLHFTHLNGEPAFRNDKISLSPFKFMKKQTLHIPKTIKNIQVDGRLSDKGWEEAMVHEDFFNARGYPRNDNRLRLGLVKQNNMFFIRAQMQGINSQEIFFVMLSAGDDVYRFLVMPDGSTMQALNEDLKWNCNWKAFADKTETGWQTEISIPLNELDLADKKLHFNTLLYTIDAGASAEMAPVFNIFNKKNMLPDFESTWNEINRFAQITF